MSATSVHPDQRRRRRSARRRGHRHACRGRWPRWRQGPSRPGSPRLGASRPPVRNRPL